MRDSEHINQNEIGSILASDNHVRTQQMYEHIATCDTCSKLFADYMEETILLRAPKDMKQNILRKKNELEVCQTQQIYHMRILTKKKKNQQMLLYSVKVALAASVALFLVARVGVYTDGRSTLIDLPTANEAVVNKEAKKDGVTTTINDALLKFSNQVLDVLK